MNTVNIHVPPMPKPEDFGITQKDWEDSVGESVFTSSSTAKVTNSAKAKITAYKEALAAWKDAVAGLRTS